MRISGLRVCDMYERDVPLVPAVPIESVVYLKTWNVPY